MEQMHHEKIGGEVLQELSLLRGEVRKLFMHFAGHQVSDFRLKCTKFDFGWGSAPDPLPGFKGAYF